ncbi:MAG: DUF4157 domain-containing protein [Proteobacteria bacterium]|nr:DUF4157 domain-containing protein [Cystobacterineae bacterium]MCL2258583.1 DUF4157 domain-containing protein [Cystobacterineae bacterium]MCL2314957.1 DUF4157 domain-containing protein [Pseudomonadota bacterium]
MKTYAKPKTTASFVCPQNPMPTLGGPERYRQYCQAMHRAGVAPRLEVGAPHNPLEREADAAAEHVMRMPEPEAQPQTGFAQQRGLHGLAPDEQRRAALRCAEVTPQQGNASTTQTSPATPELKSQLNALNHGGTPLDPYSRTFFAPRFGEDFSQVRIHTGAHAAQMAHALQAKAFTLGNNIVSGEGPLSTHSTEGKKLLAHELAHVVQQRGGRPAIQRKPANGKKKHKINYNQAKEANIKYASIFNWDTRLEAINAEWSQLWQEGKHKEFAHAVAEFQAKQGLNVDGVLGPSAWDRLRPIGEVIAGWAVKLKESKDTCTIASKERLQMGYKRATGQNLIPKNKSKNFNFILQSTPDKMKGMDKKYKGAGAAGALAYLGKGELLSEEDIWVGRKLKPGAPLQVWETEDVYEKVKNGKKIEYAQGTSYVFVEYVKDEDGNDTDEIEVRHFRGSEKLKRSRWGVWIGANVGDRAE